MEELLAQILAISVTTTTDRSDVLHKIQEEVGEVSAEMLRIKGIKPLKPGENPEEQIREEGVDLLISLLDFLHCRHHMSVEDIKKIAEPKLAKWKGQKHV